MDQNALNGLIDNEDGVTPELMKYLNNDHQGYIRVGKKGYLLPRKYREEAANIYNMKIRSTDVFVASFPRSGTTWTQELVWMIKNDLDYESSNSVPLEERYTFLEHSTFYDGKLSQRLKERNCNGDGRKSRILERLFVPGVQELSAATSDRFIKTHLPLSLLPPTLLVVAKVVYVARDPRDVAVSYFHLNRMFTTYGFKGDFQTFWKFFRSDLCCWTPYFEQLKEFWEKRNEPNMLFLFYEDLSNDLPAAVRRVSRFLKKQYSEQQVLRLCQHLSIDSFKNNKSISHSARKELGVVVEGEQPFIRTGKTGGWRDYFDQTMSDEAEKWINDNLRNTDFRFPHPEKHL